MSDDIHGRDDILRVLREHAAEMRSLGIRRVGLFGSFARGESQDASDIDLLVEFCPGQKSFDRFMELCFLLEDLFQRPVDIVTLEGLSPHLGPHILKEAIYVSVAA
jgi:uncharacterized protein